MKTKKYNATFILDTRGYDKPVDTLVEKLKGVIESVGGKVESSENMGQKQFLRVVDRKLPAGIYVSFVFEAGPTAPAQIKEKLQLDRTVNRLLILAA